MSLVKPSVLRNARLLKALRSVFGRKTFGAKSIIEAGLRKDTHGKELSAVLIACCGVSPTFQAIGTYLSKIKGSEFLGLKLTGEYSTDKKTWRYCVEAAGDAELARQLKAAKDEGRRVTQALESKAKHQAKLASVPVMEPMRFTLEDMRGALIDYRRTHSERATKELFFNLTGVTSLEAVPPDKYSAVIERCLAPEPKPSKPAAQSAAMQEVLEEYERPKPAASPTRSAVNSQPGLVTRQPGWQRRGLRNPPNTMPARVHQDAPGSNARAVVHTAVNWSPHSIFRR